MNLKKVALTLLMVDSIVIGCTNRKVVSDSSEAVANSTTCKVVPGSYDGGLSVTVNGNVVEGVIDITQGDSEVECVLKFKFEQDKECEKIVKFIDWFGDTSVGKVIIRDKELIIQSTEAPLYCQRIMDFSGGEIFHLDEKK